MTLEQRVEALEKEVTAMKEATQNQAARLEFAAAEAATDLALKTMPTP